MSGGPSALGALLRRSYARIAVPLGVAVLVALGCQLLVQAQFRTLVDHVEPLGTANAEVLQLVTDAQTGARGFQLTERSTFLEPYRQGVLNYPKAMNRARAAAGDDATAVLLLDAQERAVRAWIDRIGAPGAAGLLTDQVLGKQLFDRVRQANRQVAEHARSRLAAAHRRRLADQPACPAAAANHPRR